MSALKYYLYQRYHVYIKKTGGKRSRKNHDKQYCVIKGCLEFTQVS